MKWLKQQHPDLHDQFNTPVTVDDIIQIKGKQNAAPVAKYLPHVQDFVKSGNWGRVGDLQNSGLIDISNRPRIMDALKSRYVTDEELTKHLDSYPDIQPPPGYADGGGVVRSRFVAALAAKGR